MIVLDVETTKKPVFKPWQEGAKLVQVGVLVNHFPRLFTLYHSEMDGSVTYAENVEQIRDLVSSHDLIVGHNLKFDLLWLTSLGISFEHCQLYCTQIAEYLISGQSRTKDRGYYSLDETAKRYGHEGKIDVVKKEYWDKGVDTPNIPLDVLSRYLIGDLFATKLVHERQLSQLQRPLRNHVALACEEMRALVDIEMEGMILEKDILNEQYGKLARLLCTIDDSLRSYVGRPINLDSGIQLSCFLFGGTYSVGAREWFQAEFKSGTKIRSRKCTVEKSLPGLGFVPDSSTEYAAHPGIYSTDKNILTQLRCTTKEQKEVKKLLLDRSVVKKQLDLISNKSGGLSTLIHNGRVHTNYNQTVTATTRLSSSDPNLQNIPRGSTAEVKKAFRSQYDISRW